MGAEERHLVGDRPGDREQPRLVLDREAVSRFHLERRRSGAERFAGEPARTVHQHLVGGGSGGVDRRADPAGLVRLPSHPGIELLGPVTCEDQVRMSVDEAGERGAPLDVERRARDALGRGGSRPGPHDPVAVDRDRGVVDDPERRAVRWIVGDELADPLDEHGSRLGHRDPDVAFRRDLLGRLVTRVDVAEDPHDGIVRQDALGLPPRELGSIDHDDLTRMDRPTHEAPLAVLTSAFSSGQSAIASEPSSMASVSRYGEATEPQSR